MTEEISIYVPVFNGEKTIKQCLDSIFDQTLIPNKILVINDNSTDNTKRILDDYGNSIEVINNEKNEGVSHSRFLAVNYLKTKYIASIDADVVLSKDWLNRVYESLEKNRATLVGGKLYEKYVHNPCNYWRSLRLKQNWGEKDILNPNFIFGCNNILNTTNLDLSTIYKHDHEYYRLNGDDTELCRFLRKKNFNLYYDSSAVCFHLQDDNYETLAARYWRYVFYGDGLKKRNFFKTLKNIIRQIKKTFFWILEDLIKLRLPLLRVDFMILYYLIKIDLKKFQENNE
mgnify:FL=1